MTLVQRYRPELRLLLTCLAGMLAASCGLSDTVQARRLAREGNSEYRQARYEQAIEKYEQALKLDPETPNAYLNLGYAYFSIYDPDSEKEIRKRAAASAVDAFERHLARHPRDEASRVFEIKTMLAAASHDPQLAARAQKIFLDMLRKNPDDHEARQYLITLFIDCRRYQDALRFFAKDLQKKPDDIQTMKILAIIADKSDLVQDAVDWYWKRAEVTQDTSKKAMLFYEVGTYAWNLLHYQPDRLKGAAAIKLADQGIAACRKAMNLKEEYAEAMVYANLLYLKRALYETEEVARAWDNQLAFELRVQAGKILKKRREVEAQKKNQQQPGKQAEKKSGRETG